MQDLFLGGINMMAESFLDALVDDSLNLASNFVPLPTELMKWVFKKMKKNPNNKFLDVNFERILQYYQAERSNLLQLNFNNEIEYLPQLLEIDNTSQAFGMNQFMFDFNEEVYQLPESMKDFTSDAYKNLTKTMKYTNGENLRLSNVKFEDDMYTFETQPVYYQSYMQSNMLMDYKPKDEKSLRERTHIQGKLTSFQDSTLANHIGINILVFTPAGYLIMPQRSDKVSYAPLELSASISGAVRTHDIASGQTLDSLAIIREGIEELGLTRNDILYESIQFLGLTRELIRGGKPEIFFVMKTKLNKNEIEERWKAAQDKWENKKLNFYPFESTFMSPLQDQLAHEKFNKQFSELLEKHGAKMSLPFITNLALWKKAKGWGK